MMCVRQSLRFVGDNDPVDVVEISDYPIALGEVNEVKVLGCLAMIDEEETDWKILAIAKSNPLYEQINDEASLEQAMPGKIAVIRDWFKMYKTTDGKPENYFAFDGKFLDAEYSNEVIAECHESWQKLRTGAIPADGKSVGQ
jgi:inorganic pyrophosphatase